MENPLHHFELHEIIPLHLFGFNLSINQAVVMMWLVVAAVFLFFWAAARGAKLVPARLQNAAEMGIEFLRDMVVENMGERGLRYLPFVIALFFFILFANLLGLVPGTYTATSHLMVTGVLAVLVFGLSLFLGFSLHGLHFFSIFVPPGTPGWLAPFMIPIELFSQFVRPITLSVRLFLNMTAGHTVIAVLLGLVITGGLLLGWMPLGFTVAIYLLELMVAFIQAFVFTVLSTVYIGEAIKLH